MNLSNFTLSVNNKLIPVLLTASPWWHFYSSLFFAWAIALYVDPFNVLIRNTNWRGKRFPQKKKPQNWRMFLEWKLYLSWILLKLSYAGKRKSEGLTWPPFSKNWFENVSLSSTTYVISSACVRKAGVQDSASFCLHWRTARRAARRNTVEIRKPYDMLCIHFVSANDDDLQYHLFSSFSTIPCLHSTSVLIKSSRNFLPTSVKG